MSQPEALVLVVPVTGLLPESGRRVSSVAASVLADADATTLADAPEMTEFLQLMEHSPEQALQAGSRGLVLRCAGLYWAVLWDAKEFGRETIELATAFYRASVSEGLVSEADSLLLLACSEQADGLEMARVFMTETGPGVDRASVPNFGLL